MKIINIKVFNKTNAKMRLCALSFATIMGITTITGCSSNTNNKSNDTIYEQNIKDTKKVFEPGEHIISVPIDERLDEIKQYDYHEGYKCVGLSTSSYGQYGGFFGGACTLYVNEYSVECYATDRDKNNVPIYNNFGTPIDFEKSQNNTTAETKNFGIGEHIISIPIDDPSNSNIQYESYEGYEAVGIAVSKFGKYGGFFDVGVIMYVNTVPVTCEVSYYDENKKGHYLSFGTPNELESTKEKSLK